MFVSSSSSSIIQTRTHLPQQNRNVDYNCLDCSIIPYQSSLICNIQSDFFCPESNLCGTVDKFQHDHCFQCNETGTDSFCDICMPGYKHTASGCGCVKCEKGDKCAFGEVRVPGSCFNCTSELPTKCGFCMTGYKYVDGDCSVCGKNECCPGGQETKPSYTNCAKCSDNQTQCLWCIDNYILKDGACVKGHASNSMMNGINIMMMSFVVFIISIIEWI